MAKPLEQPQITPRVVSSIEAAMAGRRAPGGQGGPRAGPVDQLLYAMHTVKSARFNAAERLERKHMLSVFAISMVSLYFVGLSVWQAVYERQISDPTNRLITLVSIMSSIFTLVLALIDSMNDYKMKAHHLHVCAMGVNDLFQELMIERTADISVVQDYRRRYNEVVRNCPFNHARIDYLMAKAERNGAPRQERAWIWLRYASDVYALYGVCLLGPPLALLIWW